ncbi:MAG TPA: MFS transporter [Pseudonocardiaceae bacterium]|jgi:EmrB/QacA subfamily drug resistance transporter|nr:MFS transporter [Pseudonocardiaceae bacterium]
MTATQPRRPDGTDQPGDTDPLDRTRLAEGSADGVDAAANGAGANGAAANGAGAATLDRSQVLGQDARFDPDAAVDRSEGGDQDGAAPSGPRLPTGALTHRQIVLVFIGLMLGMFLAALDQMIVSVAIRTIADDLHGLDLQAWATTAYLITSTIATPLYGKLSDLYGRKPFFITAILIFIIGSIACTFATSMYMLAAFRAFQGLGAGGLMSLALAIIGDIVPPRERAKYQGYFLAVFGSASVLGPVIGGFLAGQSQILHIAGWRWVFLVNVPIAAIALIVVAKVLNIPHTRREHRIDWWGAITITVCLVPLLIIAEQGQQWGWTSPRAWLCYGVGAVGLVLFLIAELLMHDEALIPLRLFRSGVFSVTSSANFIVGMGMFGGMAVIPLYLQIVKGASPTKAGLLILPMVLGIALTSVLSGQLIARTGRYKIFPLLGTALMIAGLLLLNTITANTSLLYTDIWMFIFGLGLGNCMQTLIIAVQNAVPARDMGVASSSATFFRQMGATLGTAVFLSILFSVLGGKIAGAFSRDVPTASFQAALHDPSVVANPLNAPVLDILHHTGGSAAAGGLLQDSSFVQKLDPRLARPFLDGFTDSLHPVFLTAAVVVAVGFGVLLFLKEVPLRTQSGIEARMAEDGPGGEGGGVSVPDYESIERGSTDLNGRSFADEFGNAPVPAQHPVGVGEYPGAVRMASVSEGFVPAQTDGASISGQVRRSDGHAIADAALTLIDMAGRQVGRNVSGAGGEFHIAVPGSGAYVLIASASAHQPQASTVTVGSGPVTVDVVLTGTSSLSGAVTIAGRGTPVTGATATLADNRGEVVDSQLTDQTGKYLFAELVGGAYTLVISAEGYQPIALTVPVAAAGMSTQDVELAGGSNLRGVARVADGRAVPDARITLLDNAGNVVGVTTTDEAGEYSFADLPEGDYTVIASGYPPVASTLRVVGGEYGEHDVRLGHPEA